MTRKPAPRHTTRLDDAERHKRFIEMAAKVEASDDPKDFDRAFKKIATHQPKRESKKH